MTRDVPESETRVNMPVARPRDMRVSRNSRLKKRRGPGTITTDWIPTTWILNYNGWIPDSISWILDSKAVDSDSTDQNYLDSGFRIALHGAKHRSRGEIAFFSTKQGSHLRRII